MEETSGTIKKPSANFVKNSLNVVSSKKLTKLNYKKEKIHLTNASRSIRKCNCKFCFFSIAVAFAYIKNVSGYWSLVKVVNVYMNSDVKLKNVVKILFFLFHFYSLFTSGKKTVDAIGIPPSAPSDDSSYQSFYN